MKEISKILNEPEGTIKSKLSRGRSLIKKELESYQEAISNEKN
ncbi:RNA polymerase sigma factor [Enterococcus hailinensis]